MVKTTMEQFIVELDRILKRNDNKHLIGERNATAELTRYLLAGDGWQCLRTVFINSDSKVIFY